MPAAASYAAPVRPLRSAAAPPQPRSLRRAPSESRRSLSRSGPPPRSACAPEIPSPTSPRSHEQPSGHPPDARALAPIRRRADQRAARSVSLAAGALARVLSGRTGRQARNRLPPGSPGLDRLQREAEPGEVLAQAIGVVGAWLRAARDAANRMRPASDSERAVAADARATSSSCTRSNRSSAASARSRRAARRGRRRTRAVAGCLRRRATGRAAARSRRRPRATLMRPPSHSVAMRRTRRAEVAEVAAPERLGRAREGEVALARLPAHRQAQLQRVAARVRARSRGSARCPRAARAGRAGGRSTG